MPKRAIVVALVVAVVAACGSDTKKSSGSGADSGVPGAKVVDLRGKATGGQYPEVEVASKDNFFEPQNIRIDAGVTVKWTNEGRVAHNIVASDKAQDFGKEFGAPTADLGPGAEYEFLFAKPGTYGYYCTLHGTKNAGMFGAVIVGGGKGTSAGAASTALESGTLRVPQDYTTIQAAVDAAKPGAMVLVAPGEYHEAVTITGEHENIVIRGEDRATTIVDGDLSEEAGHENGFKVLADGVAIENITARNFKSNAFFWTGVKGYRGSYLTSFRTGDYGIYAFDAVDGQFDHDYASGSADAGYYIGQCFPCNALITDSEAEWNGLGYSGTNAGGDLNIVSSSFHHNRAGIVPNSGTGEKYFPQHGTTMIGNTVYSNNNIQTPAIDIAVLALGNGILLAGGNDNIADRNLVYDHDIGGVAAIPLPEKLINPKNANAVNFDAKNNQIINNVVSDSRQLDIGIVSTIDSATEAGGNCASGNTFASSLPANVEQAAPCGTAGTVPFSVDLARFATLLIRDNPPSVDYKLTKLPDPPASAKLNMPNAKTAKAKPATNEPRIRLSKDDLAAIEVPAKPAA